ncbi:neuronal acetylcholine receptor subunit alpha-3-like [Argopecten irradians]|uniref:neuronal acetylcholine receptor subunit alpha-3-like n=1 Tax=Argopecten irradians TaxID=31199 RepID=UPI0037133FFD
MACRNIHVLILAFSILCHTGSCQTADDVKQLMTQLFTIDGYNKFVRPSYNHSLPTLLWVNMFLVSVTDIDEVKEKMTSAVYLHMVWGDYYLSWHPGYYNGIDHLYIPQSEIWKPDLALVNGYSKMKELGNDMILTYVQYDGEVQWFPSEVFETKCNIDITYFPFDEQICDIEIGIWTSLVGDILIHRGQTGVSLKEYQENGEWDLLRTSSKTEITAADETVVRFTVHVRRKPGYIIYNLVLPVLLLSILAVFTFVIPVESGEKMGFCITMFLAFAVFITIVSAQLPASSSQSLLSKYLVFLVVMGTLITIITAVQLRINYRDAQSFPIPKWLKFLLKTSRVILCRQRCRRTRLTTINVKPKSAKVSDVSTKGMDPGKEFDDTNHFDKKSDENIEWSDVVSALDLFFFWTFLFADIFGTVLLMATGYVQSKK